MSDNEEAEILNGEGEEEAEEEEEEEQPGLSMDTIKTGLSRIGLTGEETTKSAYLTLKLDEKELTTLQGDLSLFKNLQYVHVSKNEISDLSPLNVVPSLLFVDARQNALTQFGDFGFGLEQLRILLVDNNEFERIDSYNFNQLECLSISNNKLASLDGLMLATDPLLTALNLRKNQLATLEGIEVLTKLTNLNVSDNALPDLKSLQGLKELVKLDISGNKALTPEHVLSLDCPKLQALVCKKIDAIADALETPDFLASLTTTFPALQTINNKPISLTDRITHDKTTKDSEFTAALTAYNEAEAARIQAELEAAEKAREEAEAAAAAAAEEAAGEEED